MSARKPLFLFLFACLAALTFSSCSSKKANEPYVASSYKELQVNATNLIKQYLNDAGTANDTVIHFRQKEIVSFLYEQNSYAQLWSSGNQSGTIPDSLFKLIEDARLYGLFPEDYHAAELKSIVDQFKLDSTNNGASMNALLNARADIFFTDAFVQAIKDIKLGRLPNDSISLNKDSLLNKEFFLEELNKLRGNGSLTALVRSLEPVHSGYHFLKKGIKKFLEDADFGEYTIVPARDKPGFRESLQRRLYEGGYISFDSVVADSAALAEAIKSFQRDKNITVDGKAGEGTIRMLNLSDREKFIRIAISMDKYKKLPGSMPSQYIWVNASSNYLDVVKNGEIEFTSKVICGKPRTRTPLLNSQVSALITYPQWVPPPSIVSKEILPAVKKNPGYLEKKGFTLLDKEGNEVDPYSVDWSQYRSGIPFRVVQGSGDANALGVLKFHFDNKYSVYLHDTNQRYLFGNAMRSLSHGCVRVQDWEKLALYILRNDSLKNGKQYSQADSMRAWLRNKEKHQITVTNKMPVFIRYITCEGKNESIIFYDDVYGEDRMLREKYFALK